MAFLFFNFEQWNLMNLDTGETVKGGFPGENVTETIGAEYARHWALNRQNAILQFLHGSEDSISFEATLFSETAGFFSGNPKRALEAIKKMVRRDKLTGRPPVLQFWIGDSHLSMICVMETLTTKYGRPKFLGKLHEAKLTITLIKYVPYIPGLVGNFDTRYHVARAGDTYEMLCQQEYNSPLMGVIIRQRHPKMPIVPTPGQVVKLPSVQGLRTEEIKMASYIFSRLSDTKSVQSKRLAEIVAGRSEGAFSAILTS